MGRVRSEGKTDEMVEPFVQEVKVVMLGKLFHVSWFTMVTGIFVSFTLESESLTNTLHWNEVVFKSGG